MFKKYSIIIYFLCTYSFSALSNGNLAYVDLDYIFSNTILGKKIILELKKENQKNFDNLKKKELNLIELEKDLIKKKNILSKEEFDKKFSEINSKISSFRNEKKKIIQDFDIKKKSEISSFFKKINPILVTFMKDNSLDLILDKKSVIIAKNDLEITNKIKEIIDKEMK